MATPCCSGARPELFRARPTGPHPPAPSPKSWARGSRQSARFGLPSPSCWERGGGEGQNYMVLDAGRARMVEDRQVRGLGLSDRNQNLIALRRLGYIVMSPESRW